MIDIDINGLADKLGLWPGTQWLLTLFPHWLLPWVGLLLTIGLLAGAKLLLEWRPFHLDSQYKGVWPGDLGLSVSLGMMIAGLLYYAGPVIGSFWRSTAWDVITGVVVFLAVVPLAVAEYYFAFKYRHHSTYDRPPHVYTFSQLHSPSCLAHRFGMAAVAYLFAKVWMVGMTTLSVPVWLKVVAILGVLLWFWGQFYDNFVERPHDLDDVHPYRGAWFRIGTRTRRTPRKFREAYREPRSRVDSTLSSGSRPAVAPVSPVAYSVSPGPAPSGGWMAPELAEPAYGPPLASRPAPRATTPPPPTYRRLGEGGAGEGADHRGPAARPPRATGNESQYRRLGE